MFLIFKTVNWNYTESQFQSMRVKSNSQFDVLLRFYERINMTIYMGMMITTLPRVFWMRAQAMLLVLMGV